MFTYKSTLFGCLLAITLAVGCQPVYTFVPVEGTVTQDGQPLVGVQVIFLPDPDSGIKGPRSTGITDEAGHYRLHTAEGNEGSVVGLHRVCIVEMLAADPLARVRRRTIMTPELAEKVDKLTIKDDKKPKKLKLPEIYSQIQGTPLRAEVRPGGPQTFDFDVH